MEGEIKLASVTVEAKTPVTVLNTVSVSSDTPNPFPDNTVATIETTIEEPPDVPSFVR